MKKLVFLFVAFAAESFSSCGNKAANTEATADTAAVENVVVEEAAPVADSCCAAACDSAKAE